MEIHTNISAQPRSTKGRRLRACAVALALASPVATVAPSPTAAAASSLGYSLELARTPDGHQLPIRWDPCQKAVTYRVYVAGAPPRYRATLLHETLIAMSALSAKTGLPFSYRGTTGLVPRRSTLGTQSSELVIGYTRPGATDLPLAGPPAGQTVVSYVVWGRSAGGPVIYHVAISRVAVVIDVTQVLAMLSAGFGPGLHRGNILEHELGHAVGLGHTASVTSLMYPAVTRWTPNGYGGVGDSRGLYRVGRAAGCIDETGSGIRDLS
jgi:hypothetical protein